LPAILTVDEIFYLLDKVKDGDLSTRFPARDRAVFELLYATGVRCSELVGICLQDIDFTSRSLMVTGKGRKARIVLFGQKAQKSLKKYLEKERPFLAGNKGVESLFLNYAGGKLTTRSVQRICEMFRKFLKMGRKLTPHKIRHSFATHLLNQGVDLRVVQELLGHKTLATTQIYTHVSSAELAKMCDDKHPLNAMDHLVLDG
jgi:integrase/recombinase XerC